MITLATILFFAVLAWDVITDYRKWLNNRSVKHGKEAWIRCALLVPSFVLFTLAHPGHIIAAAAYTLLMCGFVFWLLFDGLYNVLRGFIWWFTGSDDPDDAKTDNLLQKLPLWLHITLKIGGCAAGVWLYFK